MTACISCHKRRVLRHFGSGVCRNQKFEVFDFLHFFRLSFSCLLLFFLKKTLLGLVTIKLQIFKKKTTTTKNKKKQITIESGNAAQKGRYERKTHARMEKNAKI